MQAGNQTSRRDAETSLPPRGAERLYIIGGILLIACGMIFGDLFAVFTLHQNAGRIEAEMLSAAGAVAAQDPSEVFNRFAAIGGLLENRGTKVDAHVHAINFGYLALLFALIQPYVAMASRARKQIALVFLTGAVMLPVSVFLIHYVGTKYGPTEILGWASIAADFGGLLVIIAALSLLPGLLRHLRGPKPIEAGGGKRRDGSRVLLAGGTLLILAGFLHGAYYAAFNLADHEEKDAAILRSIIDNSAAENMAAATREVRNYGALAGEKAVNIAAHSHIIEFGLLAILLAFIQPNVRLSEGWRRWWTGVFLAGSAILPVFVLLELRLGTVASIIADCGGALVITALGAMLVGVLRQGVSRGVKAR